MAKIIKAFPPNFQAIAKAFPVKGRPGIIYAYGGTIYNPSGVSLTSWITAHEEVHCDRQLGQGLAEWWDHYINAVPFRLQEEILAHRKEYNVFRASNSPKDTAHWLETMVDRISSPLYGSMINPTAARIAITLE